MKIDHWLFLRGLVRESRHWHTFPEHFQKKFPSSQIHFLDLPGIGQESHRSSPTSIADIAEDLKERWNNLRQANSGRWGLFSISLGSMVALEWTSRYPENFAAQVIINTSASNLSPPWKRLKPGVMPLLLKAAAQKSPAIKENIILEATTRLVKDKEAVAQIWGEFSLPPAKMRVLVRQQLQAALRFKCPAHMSVPTLALISKSDALTDYRCSLEIAKRIMCNVDLNPESGHDLPLDVPDWTCEKVAEWLSILK